MPLPCCFSPTFSAAGGLLVRKAVATVKPARYEAAGRGAVAQMGERCNHTAEVRGSIPLGSTTTLFLPCQSVSVRHGSCCADEAVEDALRSEEHTSELQSLMRISYAVFCLKKKNLHNIEHTE